MVTQKDRVFVKIEEVENIINRSKDKKGMVDELRSLTKRQPAPPPPKGGISLRKASNKYNIPKATLSYWVKQKHIEVIKRTSNWLYINEFSLRKYINSKN